MSRELKEDVPSSPGTRDENTNEGIAEGRRTFESGDKG